VGTLGKTVPMGRKFSGAKSDAFCQLATGGWSIACFDSLMLLLTNAHGPEWA
jgi:hypothetical protein